MTKKIQLKGLFVLILIAQFFISFCNLSRIGAKEFLFQPLSPTLTEVVSFGDKQFLFRVLALKLQNFGDNWGNFTPLSEMNYPRITNYLYFLDSLDSKSNLTPFIASYIYGMTIVKKDNILITEYLRNHSLKDPDKKWRWLAHAVYIAKHKIKDNELALNLSKTLANLEINDAPIWVKQFPAFILKDLGKNDEAILILQALLESDEKISLEEHNFMQHYINQFMK